MRVSYCLMVICYDPLIYAFASPTRREACWKATEQEEDEMRNNFQTMKMDMGQKAAGYVGTAWGCGVCATDNDGDIIFGQG